MKRNVLKLFLMVLSALSAIQMNAQSQNPFWTLPPNYGPSSNLAALQSLPILSGTGNYNGQTTGTDHDGNDIIGPHNMYTDPSGNPLFSFVGGFVYGPRGALIDTLIDTLTTNIGGSNIKKRMVAGGWGEVCIVPMVGTGNCSKYYIFTAADYGGTANATYKNCFEYPGNVYDVSFRPCYAVIDMSLTDPNSSGDVGKNTSRTTFPWKPTVVDLFSSTGTTSSDGSSCSPMHGTVHYACTRLIGGTSGYRFLFCAVNDEITVYKLTNGTITFVENRDYSESYLLGSSFDAQNNKMLTELEVYADSTSGTIKLATSMTIGGTQSLVLAKYNFTTGKLDTTSAKTAFGRTGDRITGVEFSPNGSYVYVTRDSTALDAYGVEAVTFATPATVTQITGTNKNDFGHSQLELGKDGKFYFIGQLQSNTPRFAQIATPNTPSSPGFTNSYLTLSNYGLAYPNHWYYFNGSPSGGNGSGDVYVFYMPDQIDQEVYGPQFSSSTCCSMYKSYSKNYYTSTTAYPGNSSNHDQTWKGGSNPFGNAPSGTDINIESELRIASGYTVTIQNLTFKFNPQASLVVEGSVGGANAAKLILKKCTLDVDNRCAPPYKMWPGIRVWGDSTVTRNNTTQGYITLDSSCVIQNAWIGLEAGYSASEDALYSSIAPIAVPSIHAGGGYINCQNTSFINCQRGVVFRPYTLTSVGTSQCLSCTFNTNAYLLPGSSTHVLYNIQAETYLPSVTVRGCNFTCSSSLTSSGYAWGYHGIHAHDASIGADWVITGSVRNTFTNLDIGVYSHNTAGSSYITSVQHSRFFNNWEGAEYQNITNGIFSNNDTVQVRNPTAGCSVACGPNFWGLYLDHCNGYQVQANKFITYTGAKNPFGVIVNNTGSYNTWIYNNTFTGLYKGTQAQYKNYIGSGTPNNGNGGGGLVYLCNVFSNNSTADIYVPGTGKTANVGGTGLTDTAGISYAQGTGGGYPITGGNQFSLKGGGAYDIFIDSQANKAFHSNYYYYGTGSYDPLTVNNCGVVLATSQVNCSTSPYRLTNQGDLIQEYLSEAASYKVAYDSLLQIVNHTPTDDPNYINLSQEMYNVRAIRHMTLDKAIYALRENDSDSAELVIKGLMKEKALELPARSQVEVGVTLQDYAMASSALTEVASEEGQSNYVRLYTVLLNNLGKTPQEIMANPSNLSLMQAIDQDSTDRHAYVMANSLLEVVGLSNYRPNVIVVTESDSSLYRHAGAMSKLSTSSFNTKPNPFKSTCIINATVMEKTADAYILITDVLGKEVKRYQLAQGDNELSFTATDSNQQILFCSLVIDGMKIKTNKMVLIK